MQPYEYSVEFDAIVVPPEHGGLNSYAMEFESVETVPRACSAPSAAAIEGRLKMTTTAQAAEPAAKSRRCRLPLNRNLLRFQPFSRFTVAPEVRGIVRGSPGQASRVRERETWNREDKLLAGSRFQEGGLACSPCGSSWSRGSGADLYAAAVHGRDPALERHSVPLRGATRIAPRMSRASRPTAGAQTCSRVASFSTFQGRTRNTSMSGRSGPNPCPLRRRGRSGRPRRRRSRTGAAREGERSDSTSATSRW